MNLDVLSVSPRDLIGWTASAVLVFTIFTQITRQWKEGTSKGVSQWLFIGQLVASGGFLLYSWLIRDAVFIFTNALMSLGALLGLAILVSHRAKNRDGSGPQSFAA
ncbi:SemiSWEET family transporter [Candidatus Nitrospira bockiana]